MSDLLLAAGILLLLGASLMWARSALAAQEMANRRFLAASVPLVLPLPERSSFKPLAAGLPSPTPESPKIQFSAVEPKPTDQSEAPTVATPAITPTPAPTMAEPTIPAKAPTDASPAITPTLVTPPVESTPLVENTAVQEEIPAAETTPAEATLVPSNPVVYLEIPAIKVKRAVVPVGLKPDSSGGMSWDTDAIFATNNRQDLVGHLIGSAYPGQGGNIVLIGHNYNQVDLGWEGVFVNIKSLQPGDHIVIRGQDDREYTYVVQQVKQVPWRSKNAKELEKHLKFLGPVTSERLTLVTCGGANIWPFPARVYVIAVPASK